MNTFSILQSLDNIGRAIGEVIVKEQLLHGRHDYIFFEAKQLADIGKYDDAKIILEEYLSLALLPNIKALDLYVNILDKNGLREAAEQYIIRKKIALSILTKQEENAYVNSIGSKLIYEDAYLYEHKRFLCFFHKMSDPGPWKEDYSLFSDFNSLIHQKKPEAVEPSRYTNLLSTDHKSIPHSILIFVGLYKDCLDIFKKKEYLYSVLQYQDVVYENLRNDALSNHHRAYLYLSVFSEGKQEKLYFLLRAYYTVLGIHRISIDIQTTHKNKLEEEIIDIYWKIYKQKNENLQSFQLCCINLIPDFAERIKEKYDKNGKPDKLQHSIEKKEDFKQGKTRVLFSYTPFVILFFIVSFVIYIFINV